MTRLWHLKHDAATYDECAGMVLAADSAAEARQLAADNASDEGAGVWLDSSRSVLRLIGEAADTVTAGTVVLRDVWEG